MFLLFLPGIQRSALPRDRFELVLVFTFGLLARRLARLAQDFQRRPSVVPGRSQEYETAAARGTHGGNDQADRAEGAVDFHLEGISPFVDRSLRDTALVDQRSGGPDHRMNAAMFGNCGIDRRLHLRRIGHVGGVDAGLAPLRAGMVSHRVSRGALAAIDHRDITALFGKGAGHALPDAAAAAE